MEAAKCSSLFNGKTKKASTNPVEAFLYFIIWERNVYSSSVSNTTL